MEKSTKILYNLFILTLFLTPSYVLRFGILGAPSNFLMAWLFFLWLLFIIWLLVCDKALHFLNWLRVEFFNFHFLFVILFFLAGVLSIFINGFSQEKLGQFIVLFLQPIGSFIIIRYLCASQNAIRRTKDDIQKLFIHTVLFFVSIAGLYAIIQYFPLLGVPAVWWGNSVEPKRSLAFFLHPNFYALFVTPLLAFLIPFIGDSLKEKIENINHSIDFSWTSVLWVFAWLLGAIGLFLSLSRGGWLGLAAAIGVYLLVVGNRKLILTALFSVVVLGVVIFSVPNFRYRILLPFHGEKSAVSRLSLWTTGWKEIQDNPLFGKGLLGFKNNWPIYNTDLNLDPYPTPHNLYLALWVDVGFLGLVTFLSICTLNIWQGLKQRRDFYRFGLALAVIAILFHGMVDTPYLKNDLAFVFWLLFALV